MGRDGVSSLFRQLAHWATHTLISDAQEPSRHLLQRERGGSGALGVDVRCELFEL